MQKKPSSCATAFMASDLQGPAGPATSPDSGGVDWGESIEMQHKFADAARNYNWKKVYAMLAVSPSLLNTQAPYLCRNLPVLHPSPCHS